MVRILYRGLLSDRGGALLSVLAVAAAIVLVVVLEGFKVGLWRQIQAYPEQLPVQLVAIQSGVRNMTAARSVLPRSTLDEVGTVPGVREVFPLIGISSMFQQGDRKTPIYVIGYEEVGGPWRLRAGQAPKAPGDMVMDYSLARKYGLGVGGRSTLLGENFEIVGLSEGTSSMFNPYLFLRLQDAQRLFSPDHVPLGAPAGAPVSFLLIRAQPGGDVSQVRRDIEEAVPLVDVFTPDELAANDVAMAQRLMGSIMDLLVSVAYVVGILVIGLTLYAAVFERIREYGIMKAVGARNSRLYRYVLAQALIFAVAGFVVGSFASQGVAALITWFAPQYLVVPWDGQVLLRSAIAAVVMASLASLLPIRQVAGVDPALVFKQ